MVVAPVPLRSAEIITDHGFMTQLAGQKIPRTGIKNKEEKILAQTQTTFLLHIVGIFHRIDQSHSTLREWAAVNLGNDRR